MRRRAFLRSATLATGAMCGCSGARVGTVSDAGTDTPPGGPTATPETVTITHENLSDDGATYRLAVAYRARAQETVRAESAGISHRSDDGETFVVLRAVVENTGETPVGLVSAVFGLDIDSGVRPFDIPLGEAQLGGETIDPGGRASGLLATAIPTHVTAGTLLVRENQYYRANYDTSLAVTFRRDDSLSLPTDTG